MTEERQANVLELPPVLADACEQSPLVIADVGAKGGLQSRWLPIAKYVTWIGFEPDSRSADQLTSSAVPGPAHVLPLALSDRKGPVLLHRTRDEGDSSLLRPNRAFLHQFPRPERFDVIDIVELPADTLDAQLADVAHTAIDVIKLDTQGTELAILRGAAATLERGVLAVDVEVEFSPLYENQPLFADVDNNLRSHGLQLMDLAPRRWPYAAGEHLHLARGPVVWAEALYFPTAERFLQDLVRRDGSPLRWLSKAALVALVYGFPDYALTLVARASSEIGADNAEALRRAIAWWDAHANWPRVPITIEIKPDQWRTLKAASGDTGMKPTQQLRALLNEWSASRRRRR